MHLLHLGEDEATAANALSVYDKLTKQGVEAFYDDRANVSAGEKFADADLLGIPYRITVSKKTLAENSVELKLRLESESQLIPLENVTKELFV